jgi:predicted DNA-binding transcriptional regulator YafY
MNRLNRITAIFTQLQSNRSVTAKEISDKFEISLRTVYRDIKYMQDSGTPIGSEAGLGYFIVKGYYLPPVTFTKEEASAFIAARKFISQNSEASLVKNYESGLTKIKANLKIGLKDNAELSENRITSGKTNSEKSKSNVLSIVQQAIINFRLLKIEYNSLTTREITTRTIEPMGLYFTDKNWIMIAHCQLRNDLRDFRLDRIINFSEPKGKSEKAKNFVLSDYFRSKIKKSSKPY